MCVCETLGITGNRLIFDLLPTHLAGCMAAVSLAMPTKVWDSAGRECGRTFLYLHSLHSFDFSLPPGSRL